MHTNKMKHCWHNVPWIWRNHWKIYSWWYPKKGTQKKSCPKQYLALVGPLWNRLSFHGANLKKQVSYFHLYIIILVIEKALHNFSGHQRCLFSDKGPFTNYVYKFCQFLTTYLPLFTLVNFWTTTYLPLYL